MREWAQGGKRFVELPEAALGAGPQQQGGGVGWKDFQNLTGLLGGGGGIRREQTRGVIERDLEGADG